MHTTDSAPEVGASAANAGHPRNSEHDNQPLPDRSFRGNSRRLIWSQCGTELYEVFEIPSYFELVSASEIQRFSELWEGYVGQIRLSKSLAANREGAQ
jgi:hypothetical protein